MDRNKNKLVVVLNEKLEKGKAANALAHAMLGFGAGRTNKDEVFLNRYEDAEKNIHDSISEMPIVILQGRSNQLRTLRKNCVEHDVQFTDFLDGMSIGTYEEECALMASKKDDELTYWAIVVMGPRDLVTEWTKKLSLYR